MCVCVNIHIYICVCVCIHIYMCVCVCLPDVYLHNKVAEPTRRSTDVFVFFLFVADEATASIDNETDSVLQAAIRDMFADCTVRI